MITQETIQAAVVESKRFVEALRAARRALSAPKPGGMWRGTKETAALKRASMDLSRALSELRRPKGRDR